VVDLRPYGLPRVFTDGRTLYTENLVPGQSVYGERLIRQHGTEFREWEPHRSKLAALLLKGGRDVPLRRDSKVLYLGAASGTTVSHVSDICSEGTVCAVEVSRRVFVNLLALAETRRNVLPILADASQPEAYANRVERVGVVYQDIAQRDQVPILLGNLRFMEERGTAVLMVKSRSIDVARRPEDVYREVEAELTQAGLRVLSTVPLDPFQRDHAAVVARREGGP
jgi:fibrillarin-like pre-rRNA processing protein